jgi:branched-chain amino acid aminotransferase
MSPSATTRPLNHAIISDCLPPKSHPNGYVTANAPPPPPAELDASALLFTPTTLVRTVPEPNSPEILSQSACTDHMITASWTQSQGWSSPEMKPYGPFSLMPTASVLHYATECFEGLKAYRGFDGKLRLFRPDRNCNRMLVSSARVALPTVPPKELEKLMKALLAIDGPKWLPKSRPGKFIYLRPAIIATHPALGVQKPKEALLFIIACFLPCLDEPAAVATPQSPVAVTPHCNRGLKLLASSDDMIRAWPGGYGYAKIGANYGPSLVAQASARERGCEQILWLFGDDCYVTEAGASNFFVVWGTREGGLELVTAPLEERLILDGVTRASVLELARERLCGGGKETVKVVERGFTMFELAEAVEEGRIIEAFAAGTAVGYLSLSLLPILG